MLQREWHVEGENLALSPWDLKMRRGTINHPAIDMEGAQALSLHGYSSKRAFPFPSPYNIHSIIFILCFFFLTLIF